MKITHKLITSFWLIVVCIWSVSFYAIAVTKNNLERFLIEQDVRLAHELTNEISHLIYSRFSTVQEYATEVFLGTMLEESNATFARYADIDKHIQDSEKKLIHQGEGSENILSAKLSANSLSAEFRKKQEYYRKINDYDLFTEIFATNRFGAVVGLTNRTTDYRQDDEVWWQKAQENDFYISDIAYHESINLYSIDFAFRVNNIQGDSLGVLKAVYNIEEILRLLERAKAEEGHEVIDYVLATGEGRVLYSSTKHVKYMEDISQKEGFINSTSDICYPAQRNNNKIHIHAHLPGYNDMPGPDWVLIIGHNLDDIFAPVNSLKNKLFIFALSATFFVFLLSLLTIRLISKPLITLKNAVGDFGKGQFTRKIEVTSSDEIGEVAAAFNAMSATLQETTVSRDTLAVEIEERTRLEKKLQESEKRLSSIINSLLSGIIIIDAETHVIIDANPAALTMFAATKEEIIGKTCYQFFCHMEEGKCPVTDKEGVQNFVSVN